jgi:hypothetical protein
VSSATRKHYIQVAVMRIEECSICLVEQATMGDSLYQRCGYGLPSGKRMCEVPPVLSRFAQLHHEMTAATQHIGGWSCKLRLRCILPPTYPL